MNRLWGLLLAFCAFVVLGVSCTSAPKAPEMTPEMNANLTQIEAEYRARQVQNVKYDLEFTLPEGETYSGVSRIQFDALKTSQPIRIDFHKGKVLSFQVNGEKLPVVYNGHYLLIPEKNLKSGQNIAEVVFEHDYSREGRGLHRFKDPEDGRVYVYSDLQPFDANNAFPCFDQPDLRATYKMKVTAPKDWIVVTSVMESSTQANAQDTLTWNFPESAKFSTYIWSLHAGPYKVWSDNKGEIPLRLMARQSVAKYVKPEDWFPVTRQGFQFFNAYFDYPYPYKKYDQLMVPEFNAGAMENVAAVTFNERFISRGEKSREEKRNLANVILHEMAHMWFGNLVTMKWWNDLWLNESFATYMAYLASAEATEFKEAWRDFNGTKLWAYTEDQMVTTHPIEGPVEDTLQTFANFDGITYGKGASVLKQIAYFVGPENFRDGLRHYFKTYAEKNTELKDFMASLSQAAGRDLDEWQKLWLQTSGVNTLKADYTCDNGKVTEFKILQTAPEEHPHIRPQAFEIAFLNKEKDTYHVTSTLKAEISQENTSIPGAIGKVCPDIVYPNYGDHGYFKVALDSKSLDRLKSGMIDVENSHLRQLFWLSLWDMVRSAELSYQAFGDIILTGSLRSESDEFVLERIFQSLHGWREFSASVLFYYNFQDGMSETQRKQFIRNLETLTWQRLQNAKAGSEMQKLLFTAYVRIAQTQPALNNLKRLLDGTVRLRGLTVDQDKRWNILERLAQFNFPGSERLVSLEEKRDSSALGKEEAIAARASMPSWDVKETWLKEFKNKDSQYSLRQFRVAFGNLMPPSQNEFRVKYSKNFYEDLKVADASQPVYKAALLTNLTPFSCGKSEDGNLKGFIETNPQLKPTIRKALRIMHQESQLCGKITALAASGQHFSNPEQKKKP